MATGFSYARNSGTNTKTAGASWARRTSPASIRRACEGSLRRLGVEAIGIFYQHRADPKTPPETVAETVAELIKEGKVLKFGMCEVGASTIRRAHAVCPITAIQSEYHLMHRTVEDNGVLAACRELGIGFVPYSPINRGFHGGAYKRILALRRKRQPPRSSAFPTRRNPRKSAHSRNTQRIRKAARPDLRASRPYVAHVKVAEHSPHSRDNKAFASRRKFALRRRQTFRIRNCRIGGFNFKNRNCRGALQRRTAAEGGIVKQAAAIFALALAAVSPASGKPPIILSDQGSFAVGGTALSDRKGRKFHGDHAYVFYQIPENARKYPLVFAHGVGQFSKTWETTPDGREGFQNIFLRKGFSVYLADQPRRGNAGRSTEAAAVPNLLLLLLCRPRSTADGPLWENCGAGGKYV